jgi:EpsD family peptidyl-prolyl cis-trans isomerase
MQRRSIPYLVEVGLGGSIEQRIVVSSPGSIKKMKTRVGSVFRQACTVVSVLAAGVTLTACSDANAPSSTQVAVRVNKSEISVHQVNYALQSVQGGASNASDAATRQAVDRLVAQQLAVDRALELKLDLVPEVQQSLQEARREVLARAHFDRIAAATTQPDSAAVSAFYDQRPELFAQRRNFAIQEIDIEASGDQLEALRTRLGEMPMPAFAEYLRGSGLRYKSRLVNEPSENLSMELIGRLASMKEGQSFYVTRPSGLKVLLLVSARPAPVTLSEATPAIKRYLLNEASRKAIEADMKDMQSAAKLQYFGRFVTVMAAAATASGAAGILPAASAAVPADEPRKAPDAR